LVQWLSAVPVLASILLIAKLVASWTDLPDRVAVHFGLDGQPNSYASKSAFIVIVGLVALGFMASLAILSQFSKAPGPVMVITITSVVVTTALWQVIDFNVSGKPIRMGIILVPLILLIALSFFFVFPTAHHLKP
jgi:hypothetical protein